MGFVFWFYISFVQFAVVNVVVVFLGLCFPSKVIHNKNNARLVTLSGVVPQISLASESTCTE